MPPLFKKKETIMTNKAIYKPSGKAGEYAKYACNFYIGCSIGCTYCYNKTGRFASTLGGNTPTLKKCFKDQEDAFRIFRKEAHTNLQELQTHGIFFSFTTDPMLPETRTLTTAALFYCQEHGIPVQILTKDTTWVDEFIYNWNYIVRNLGENWNIKLIAFGVSISGAASNEPGASTEQERIDGIIKLHKAGFRTFISFEPVIKPVVILKALGETSGHCDLYRIGIDPKIWEYNCSQAKAYTKTYEWMHEMYKRICQDYTHDKFYLKDSILKALNIDRCQLTGPQFVPATHTPFSSPSTGAILGAALPKGEKS